jgi:hypothetical protein
MRYLGRFLDQTDPTASLRHAAYAVVVVFALGWLTWDMIRGPITSEWNVAFGLLMAAVTTGKLVGAAASPAPGLSEPDRGTHG